MTIFWVRFSRPKDYKFLKYKGQLTLLLGIYENIPILLELYLKHLDAEIRSYGYHRKAKC
jgi:hypothetical protein